MKLIISQNLALKNIAYISSYKVLPFRKLRNSEKQFIRNHKIKRYYLPELDEKQADEFYGHFDCFWESLSEKFGREHYFWRNVVSSKMQEWESSLSYIALAMFSLKMLGDQEFQLWIVCGSIEEEEAWRDWARLCHWTVVNSPAGTFKMLGLILQGLENNARFIQKSLRTIYKKMHSPRPRFYRDHPKNIDNILVASLFYSSNLKNDKFQDPFFGALHNDLMGNNKRCTYLSDVLDSPNSLVARGIEECKEAIINTPHSLLSWKEIFKVLVKTYFRKIDVDQAEFSGCDLAILLRRKSHDFHSDFNISAEIYYEALKKVYQQSPFDHLLVVYEGNVFERACIQASRECSDAKIGGYSQGVIYPLNLKLRITEKEMISRPEPDFIVCTGSGSREALLKMGQRKKADIREGCSLRHIPSSVEKRQTKLSRGVILIALDGVYSTVAVLDWLVEHKETLRGFQVRVRAHPNVPMSLLEKNMFYRLPPNFILSSNSLEEDLKESFCVLYRHTSIGIQALMNGIGAIHLAIDSPLSGDPIKDLSVCKWSVRTADELKNALEEAKTFLLNEEQKIQMLENKVLKGYFASPTEERMCDFLAV